MADYAGTDEPRMDAHTHPASAPLAARADSIFGVLSNRRCRLALYRLSDAGTPLALADLAREITEDGARPGDSDIETLYQRLYHVDIPKLVESGLVVYDPDSNAVALSKIGEDLDAYLELVRRDERRP